MKTRTSHRTRFSGGRRLAVAACLCVLASSLVWAGCSIERNYATLSFFFDGVPNPEAKARAAALLTADMRASATYTLHKPFAEEQCAECHTGKLKITDRDSQMCMKCHADAPTKYVKMHGPVAAAACLWCHSPHESAEAHLLRKPARQVCAQCHDQTLLSAERVPAHADAQVSCLDCHNGHGGPASMFLKEGISRPAPSAPDAKPQPK